MAYKNFDPEAGAVDLWDFGGSSRRADVKATVLDQLDTKRKKKGVLVRPARIETPENKSPDRRVAKYAAVDTALGLAQGLGQEQRLERSARTVPPVNDALTDPVRDPLKSRPAYNPVPAGRGDARQFEFTQPAPAVPQRAVSGFQPRSELFHRLFNLTCAGAIFVMALPVILLLTALVFVTQGRPVFYRGERVGREGVAFDIFKFRTLDTEKAAKLTKNQVLPKGSGLETPMGGFLRDTRLDELPQLWNIIRGDMNICGPRPVRPQIAELQRKEIEDYDVRFAVKPGMLGPTQALMGHGTPKTVRARLNNTLCRRSVSYWRELEMMALVPACVLARTFTLLGRRLRRKLLGNGADGSGNLALDVLGKSAAKNLSEKYGVAVCFKDAGGALHPITWIDDQSFVISERFDLFETGATSSAASDDVSMEHSGALLIALPDGTTRRARIHVQVLCTAKYGEVSRVPGSADGLVELRYAPASAYAHHVLERYLNQRVVVPHRSHFFLAWLLRLPTRLLGGRKGGAAFEALGKLERATQSVGSAATGVRADT